MKLEYSKLMNAYRSYSEWWGRFPSFLFALIERLAPPTL